MLYIQTSQLGLLTMYILFTLLILIYFNAHIDSHDIEVMNSGIMKLKKEDMIIVLFLTIHHHGEKARNMMATMVECCEKINDDDTDCSIIQVFGEHLGVVEPGTTLNVTFIYPNIYGYNRRASCVVDIWNRREGMGVDDTNEIRHRIDFDTTIRLPPEVIPPHLQGLYNPDKITRCETTDLDPFDGCNPVDCRSKYSGLRNFFNHKRKRCQKVPKCEGDPNKDLPDVIYVPTSNTCRNLDNAVSKEEILDLIKNKYETASNDLERKSVNIQCHHGEIDVRTGLCVCDKGWTSEAFDPEEYNQGNFVYNMCDKQCHPQESPSLRIPVIMGVVLAFIVFFFVLICEYCNYCKLYKKLHEEEEEICYYPRTEN